MSADSMFGKPADAWGSQFVKLLETKYADVVANLPPDCPSMVFRSAMLRAFAATCRDSEIEWGRESGLSETNLDLYLGVRAGDRDSNDDSRSAGPKSLADYLDQVDQRDCNVEWSSESSARRIALIDKMIQQQLSSGEAAELAKLTAKLRQHVDAEERLPMAGARRLHKQLLEQLGADPISE